MMVAPFRLGFVRPESLAQMPSVLRQCSHLPSAKLSYSSSRTFSTSLIFHAKKPGSAIVKSQSKAKVSQKVQSKQTRKPETRSSPSKAAPVASHVKAQPKSSGPAHGTTPDSHASPIPDATIKPQSHPKQDVVSSAPELASRQLENRTAPPPPRAYRPITDPVVHKLATGSKPTLLYQLPSQRSFVFTSFSSSAFCTYIGIFTLQSYAGVVDAPPLILYAGYFFATLWCSISAWCGLAPYKLITHVWAVPTSPQGNVDNAAAAMPLLRFQPLPLLPFVKTKTFDVPARNVVFDRAMAPVVAASAVAREAASRETGVLAALSRRLGVLATNVHKTFSRKQYVRMRIQDSAQWKGNWKLDARHCKALSNGQAIDRLIKVDEEPINWYGGLIKKS